MSSRTTWNPQNPRKQQNLLRELERGDKCFNDVVKAMKWSRQTVNLYLQELLKKNWIKSNKNGKKNIYSLNRAHPEVVSRLAERLDIPIQELDETTFIASWVDSINIGLLNIIQEYSLLIHTPDPKRMQRIQGHISDMIETITWHGHHLVQAVEQQRFSLKKIILEVNHLKNEIKDKHY